MLRLGVTVGACIGFDELVGQRRVYGVPLHLERLPNYDGACFVPRLLGVGVPHDVNDISVLRCLSDARSERLLVRVAFRR